MVRKGNSWEREVRGSREGRRKNMKEGKGRKMRNSQ